MCMHLGNVLENSEISHIWENFAINNKNRIISTMHKLTFQTKSEEELQGI